MSVYNLILHGFVLVVLLKGFDSMETKMYESKLAILEASLQNAILSQNLRIEQLETILKKKNNENHELMQKYHELETRFALYEAKFETIQQTLKYGKGGGNNDENFYVRNSENPASSNRQKSNLTHQDVERSLPMNKTVIGQGSPNSERERRLLSENIGTLVKRSVAFYAYMSTTEASPIKHHTLIYDVEKVDIGGGYNNNTGVFTIPTDGIYVFSFSVRVYCNAYAGVEIVKNGIPEGFIIADARRDCYNDMTSGTAVIPVIEGDVVYVRTSHNVSANGQIYNGGYGRASFCGWLLG